MARNKATTRISEDFIRNNAHTFREYLEKHISVKDLIGHTDFFTREQRHELLLESQTKPTLATRKALDIIEEQDQPDKYTRLVNALKEGGYPKLVGLLNGNFVHTNDFHLRRLNGATALIYQRLNPSDAVPYLLQKGVISFPEAVEIRCIEQKSRSEAALSLLYILPNRHRYWYELTIRSLLESGQAELAKEIDAELTKVSAIQTRNSLRHSKLSLQSVSDRGESPIFTDSDDGRDFHPDPEHLHSDIQDSENAQRTIHSMITKMKTFTEELEILIQKSKNGQMFQKITGSDRKHFETMNNMIDKLQPYILTAMKRFETGDNQTRSEIDKHENKVKIDPYAREDFRVDYNNSKRRRLESGPFAADSKTNTYPKILNDIDFRPGISGCTFLPKGELVLCIHNNKVAKLLDASLNISDSILLQSGPWDVAVVESDRVIVTLPCSYQLQYMEVVSGRLTPSRKIHLDKECWGIHVFNCEIYVSCFSSSKADGGEVRIMDSNGNPKRSVGINQDGTFLFCRPYYLTFNHVSRKLYVSDLGIPAPPTLYCLTLDGHVVYKYKDKELRCGTGVFVDMSDNVHICDAESNNVHVVAQSGKRYNTVMSCNYGKIGPHCIDVRDMDGTIVIGSNCLFIFKGR